MTLLSVRNVSKSFGGLRALDGCSFDVKEGEILGLIGPNGSGKTTMFNLITGIYDPDKGGILFKGEDIIDLDTHEVAQLGIGRTFQLIRLFPKLTVLDNMLIARRYIKGDKFWPQLLGKRHVLEEDKIHTERCRELLRVVNLDEKRHELAENLSYGQQKLLEIARALALEPQLLLLDEPIAGVNPTMAKKILEIIGKLNKEGKTIVIVEHNMAVMMNFCRRIIVLDYGKKLAEGKPSQIKRNRKVVEAYLGK